MRSMETAKRDDKTLTSRKNAPGRCGEEDDKVPPPHVPQCYYDEEAPQPKGNESEQDLENATIAPTHYAVEAAGAAPNILVSNQNQRRFPGAVRVDGIDGPSEEELSFGGDNGPPPEEAPPAHDGRCSSNSQEFLVVATTVAPPIFAAEATPLRLITRRRILIVAALIAVLLGVVIAAFMVTRDNNDIDGDPSPTPPPTDWPKDWNQVGQDFIGYSDDEGGAAVAISRNGLAVAVGSPNAYAGNDMGNGMVKVYKYQTGGWDLKAAIRGEAIFDELGRSVALSDDGSIVAVGIPSMNTDDLWGELENATSNDPGRVRVYRINKEQGTNPEDESTHVQIGSDIVGQAPDDQFGWSVDIAGNGLTVAIGARQLCLVRVLRFSENSKDWERVGKGTGCFGSFSSDDLSFGASVSVSNDGSIVAVGAPGSERGSVHVFRYNEGSGGAWEALGQKLEGKGGGDAFGRTLSLSDNGLILAVGSPFDDGDEPLGLIPGSSEIDADLGSCRVFEYSDASQHWRQLGSDIVGAAIFENFGTSVALSSDGTIVAIGAVGSNDNGDDSGLVRVLQYDDDVEQWDQIGSDIVGPFAFAQSGTAVAISSDGLFVTVGSPNQGSMAGNNDRVGSARVYETSIIQKGEFPITVRIQLDTDPEEFRWYMERLDSVQNETVIVASFPERSYVVDNETVTETVWVVEGGVYRFMVDRRPLWGDWGNHDIDYALFLSNTTDEEWRVASGSLNINRTFSENSFIARASNASTPSPSGTVFVTLVIDFDQRPGDIHWVLLSKELVVNTRTERLEKDQMILAFGPEESYGEELALSRLTRTIDVSSVPPSAEVMFIFSDAGRDGLCCEYDAGSYKLYKGSSTGNDEEDLLFAGSAEAARRAVHSFSMF